MVGPHYRRRPASCDPTRSPRIDLAFLPLSLVGPAQAGKLRLIAVASDDRAPRAPAVPTAKEAGFPALSVFGGHGLFAHKEMPEALRARIAEDVREIATNTEVAQRLLAMGYIPRAESRTEFTAILQRERTRWTEVAQMYGAKPSQ
jgi:tripartite-type tricarboxylate transporter receptor subunit TctC